MNDILFKVICYLILAAITAIVGYLCPLFKTTLNSYVSKIQNEKLQNYVVLAVQAAESKVKELLTGGDKKQYVTERIKEFCDKNSITITDEQIEVLIQGVFQELDGITINKL